MTTGRFAFAAIVITACSQPVSRDAATEAGVTDVVDAVVSDATPWTLEGTVVDEFAAPLEGVSVRAARGDVFFETSTDADGRFRFAVDDDGPWDVTAAMAGRMVVSWIGVDGPFTQPIRLPSEVVPRQISFAGTSPPIGPGHVGFIQIMGGQVETIHDDDWTGHYDFLPSVTPPYPDVRAFMLDIDPLHHLVNVAVSAPFPRDGRPIANTELVFPPVPPPIRQTNVTLRLPNAGLLSSESVITDFLAVPMRIGPGWSTQVGRGLVDGPYDGVAQIHYEYIDGELAPDHMIVNATFVRTHPVLGSVARRSFTEGEVITFPVVRVLQVDGTTLGDATFSSDATPDGQITVRLIDPTLGVAWMMLAFHPERPFFHRLPLLPTSVALASVTSGDGLTAAILSSHDPELPDQLHLTSFGTLVASFAVLGVEGR